MAAKASKIKDKSAQPAVGVAGGGAGIANELRALLACSDLTGIDFVNISAERRYGDSVHGGELSAPELWHMAVSEAIVRYPTEPSVDGAAIVVEIKANWHDGAGKVYATAVVCVRVAYAFRGLTVAPADELLARFANDLGLHHAWPFLRERLRTLSSELGLPPVVLPLRKR